LEKKLPGKGGGRRTERFSEGGKAEDRGQGREMLLMFTKEEGLLYEYCALKKEKE